MGTCKFCETMNVRVNDNEFCKLCARVLDQTHIVPDKYNDIRPILKTICIVGNEIIKHDPLKEQILDFVEEQSETDLEQVQSAVGYPGARVRNAINDLMLEGLLMMREDKQDEMIIRLR